MGFTTSRRTARLIAAALPGRPYVEAVVFRDYPAAMLEVAESFWANAREAAAETAGQGLVEHAHWDWRRKRGSVEAGHYTLFGVEYDDRTQGLMATQRLPRPALVSPSASVVYVDYLEVAPWNLKAFSPSPRYIGVGTILLGEAVRSSMESGSEGRVGLHSLPQAEGFYRRCGMTPTGPDAGYYDLAYFEYTGEQAARWLAELGEPS